MTEVKCTYKNIAIIRLSALGDIVHTLPAFAFLREKFPQAKISWLVGPAGARLLKNFRGVDEIIVLDLKKKGFFNKFKELHNIRSRYRKTFDLVLDFQGLLKSALISRMLKSPRSVGFHKDNLREHQLRFLYNQTADFFDESNHVAFKNLHLAAAGAGLSLNGLHEKAQNRVHWEKLSVETANLKQWEPGINDFLTARQLEKNRYLIVNIGGGWMNKILPTHRYIELIKAAQERFPRYPVVVLWGTANEKVTAEKICAETGAKLADFFNFSQLILFIKYCRTIVTSDTLALHLADMVKKPSVGIFGPTSPFRNGSLLEDSVSIFNKVSCGFCYKKKCGKISCIENIKTEDIIKAIEKFYETS